MKTLFGSRTTVNSTGATPGAYFVLPLCFLLSGLAGIVYQIAWTRQLALVFGTTETAVTVVLAGYMAGLAVGAWLIQRLLPFLDRPVLTYAVLELLIAVSAVALVPVLIGGSDWLLQEIAGHQAEPPGGSGRAWIVWFYAVAAFVALVIPTLCMGATLPVLTRHVVESDRQTGARVGMLLTFNTAGAVAGALAAPYWMLPTLGLTRTVWSAAAVNVLAALLSLTVARRTVRRSGFSAAWAAASRVSFARPPAPAWVLPLILVSGAVALFHEVLWTRLLTHVLGSSLHAFGILLASFLGGLALGAAVGAMLAQDRRSAVPGFAISQLACALAAAAAYILVNRFLPDTAGLVSSVLLTATILVPIAFFSGASFPLAVRILARRTEDAAPAAARVYAWNTLGAIVGALLGGFVLIPSLRFEGSIHAAVLVSVALAVGASLLVARPSRVLVVAVGLVALVIAVLFWPTVPMALLRSSPLHISNAGRMLYYAVGRTASVIVLEQEGSLALRTNGLPEAMVDGRGVAPRLSGEKWLVPCAILTRPRTSSLLLVGYGGGVVLEDVPATVQHIDVLEIEPRVIDANTAIAALRKHDPLADRRVNVVINDARVALDLTERRYDAIVSQPSHPWTAAASHLYTREFLRQSRDHLTVQGVFVQWMNISFIDESLLRSFAATVLDVFADVRLYRPDPFTLIFVATQQPDPGTQQPGAQDAAVKAFSRLGINTPEDLFVALVADGQALSRMSKGAPLITDDRNRMATRGVSVSLNPMTPARADRLLAPHDPMRLVNTAAAGLQQGYVARRLATLSALNPGLRNRLDTFAGSVDAASETAYEVNAERLRVDGDDDAAQELIQQGLARYPANDSLRFEYIRPWLSRLARGTATREVTAQAAKFKGSADAVVRGTLLAAQSRWDDLSTLDASLAEATWLDPWKLDAIMLQAQWRYKKEEGTSEARHQNAEEALSMIDEAIAFQPAIVLYQLRLQCALAARHPDAVLESISAYGQGLTADPLPASDAAATDRSQVRTALTELLRLLDKQAGADPARVAEVRDGLLNDVRELSR